MYPNILVFFCLNLKLVIVLRTSSVLMRPVQNQMYKIAPAVYIFFTY